jgi:hypothetical protein
MFGGGVLKRKWKKKKKKKNLRGCCRDAQVARDVCETGFDGR